MSTSAFSTRVLPGLTTEYAIVGLPEWAWFWIDDHVEEVYANDYRRFMKDAGEVLNDNSDIPNFLSLMATDLRNAQLRDMHNLANDNNVLEKYDGIQHIQPPKAPYQKHKFPTIFMIFKFLPHATDLKTIWHRRNYKKYF